MKKLLFLILLFAFWGCKEDEPATIELSVYYFTDISKYSEIDNNAKYEIIKGRTSVKDYNESILKCNEYTFGGKANISILKEGIYTVIVVSGRYKSYYIKELEIKLGESYNVPIFFSEDNEVLKY